MKIKKVVFTLSLWSVLLAALIWLVNLLLAHLLAIIKTWVDWLIGLAIKILVLAGLLLVITILSAVYIFLKKRKKGEIVQKENQ
ncbi:MAG: hypothetical protein RMM17_00185 [Acidobacteriota bacterium]|nr:hypothetical protein [Blastocatellia bacterium]MDW8411083.1 hypothetical protein [Acidobacteriota bacterium]